MPKKTGVPGQQKSLKGPFNCQKSPKCSKLNGHMGPCNKQRVYCGHISDDSFRACDKNGGHKSRHNQLLMKNWTTGDCFYSKAVANPVKAPVKPFVPTFAELKLHQSRIEKLLRFLTSIYPKDRLCPGFVTSFVREKQSFYCSIVRYDSAPVERTVTEMLESPTRHAVPLTPYQKQVLFAEFGPTRIEAEIAVMKAWKNSTKIRL